MNRYFFLVIICSFSLVSCSKDTKEIVNKDAENNILEVYSVDVKSGKKQGLYKRYFPSGQVKEIANYQQGVLDGNRKFYYESGDVEQDQNYLDGLFQGAFHSYYINGKVNMTGNYLNNEMDGQWKRYYETGELKEVVRFANNEENGPFKEYYKNGQLKAEGNYVNGPYEHGELKEYDDKGEVVRIMLCENGICRTKWKK